jgi:hypothetical protein
MADEIIEELWAAKDAIAKEADYDIDKLVDLLEDRAGRRTTDPVELTDPKG